MQETTKQMKPPHNPQQLDLRSSVGIALEINSLIIIKFAPWGYASILWLCMVSEPHKQQLLLVFSIGTRVLHNSQYPIARFFTYHLRMGRALCRTHKNAHFERVSPHSQKAVLSDYLPMKTLPPTAEIQWGICPEGHKEPWRLARLTPLSWMSLLHRCTGRQGGGRSTVLERPHYCLSPLCHPVDLYYPPGSLPAPPSAFRLHVC